MEALDSMDAAYEDEGGMPAWAAEQVAAAAEEGQDDAAAMDNDDVLVFDADALNALPEAVSVQVFMERPNEFRPQRSFLEDFIEVSFSSCVRVRGARAESHPHHHPPQTHRTRRC